MPLRQGPPPAPEIACSGPQSQEREPGEVKPEGAAGGRGEGDRAPVALRGCSSRIFRGPRDPSKSQGLGTQGQLGAELSHRAVQRGVGGSSRSSSEGVRAEERRRVRWDLGTCRPPLEGIVRCWMLVSAGPSACLPECLLLCPSHGVSQTPVAGNRPCQLPFEE